MSTNFKIRRPAPSQNQIVHPKVIEDIDEPTAAEEQAAPAPKKAPAGKASPDPVAKLTALAAWANTQAIGREDLVGALVLAMVARQNVTALGVPGTAKTYTVRKVTEAFAAKPGDVFDILLTKFTKPSEVLGPPSIKALENDEFRYCTEGFLPTAKVGILDEMYKGSSAILNALLQIANDRTFKNGKTTETTPLRFLVGMSNEFPEDPATLAAFFDRFPIKLMVNPLESSEFETMLAAAAAGKSTRCPVTMNDADLSEIDRRVDECAVSQEIIETLRELKMTLEQKNVRISDRRWVQALRILKASAVIAGRAEVSRTDLKALEYVCWNTQADIAVIKSAIPDFLRPFDRQLREVIDEVYAERETIYKAANLDGADKTRPSPDGKEMSKVAAQALSRIKGVNERVTVIVEEMAQTDEDKSLAAQATKSITAVMETVKNVMMGKQGIEALKATEKSDIGA